MLLCCCCCVVHQVSEQDIANIVAQWTGIPIEKVSADETERLIKMEEVLHGRVIGQVGGVGEGAVMASSGARGGGGSDGLFRARGY